MKKTVLFFLAILISTIVSKAQLISTIAGTGTTLGDNGPASAAQLNDPICIIFDKNWNIYFSEGLGARVRKIDNFGIITTIAGTGSSGDVGDGGPATIAKFKTPAGIALDPKENFLYICDNSSFKIRKVNLSTGIVSPVAGTGTSGYLGEGGPASSAMLKDPQDICFDENGVLYIADGVKIRKIDTFGIIHPVAGNGLFGYSGDNGPASAAQMGVSWGIRIDNSHNIYFSDIQNERVRMISSNDTISTIAGNGSFAFSGDLVAATAAGMSPKQIAVDNAGSIYVSDDNNKRVYKIDKAGILHLFAGNGAPGYNGDGIGPTTASIDYPTGIAFDSCGNVLVCEVNDPRIRKITFPHCGYLSVEDSKCPVGVNIFPNPTWDELHIDGFESDKRYEVVDAFGKLRMRGILHAGNNSISVFRLPHGFYELYLIDEYGQKEVRKFVKQ